MAGTWVRGVRRGAARVVLGGAILGATILGSTVAWATTVMPIEDARMVDTAPVILVGRVEGTLPATGEGYVTRWLVGVERVLKGEVVEGTVEVVVAGGENASGDRLVLFGAPEFRRNERALLFLAPEGPGRYRVFHFTLGAFHRVHAGERAVAAQDLSEVRVVGRRGRRAARRGAPVRDFERFADWIADRAAGVARPEDYRFRPARDELRALRQAFQLFSSNGLNYRWFLFDDGGSVPWMRNGTQAGLGSGGRPELDRARAAWNGEPTTPVNLVDAGETGALGGLRGRDSVNTVLFGDPNGEVEDLDCGGGGILARGGFYSFRATARFDGRDFYRISEGDIVVNNGLECILQTAASPSRYIEELLGHELGHTLGILHSSENPNEPNPTLRGALMYYSLSRSSTSGARLNSDDVAALQTLYRRGGRVGGGGGGGGGGTGNCPVDTLCLLGGRFQVTATWENQFNGLSGAAHPVRASDVAGYFYFDDGRNYELIFKMLDFGEQVKVFYGQLTNLHFTITVRDTRTGAVKTYSNTPGDCGALDGEGFPSNAVVAQFARLRGRRARSTLGSCQEDADTICLLGGRFAVEMTWRNQYNDTSGVGIPRKLTDLTGAFGFTSVSNLEVLLKTVQFPDHVLVIYGALSDLEYRLRITDTIENRTKEYFNPAGQYCGGLDGAF